MNNVEDDSAVTVDQPADDDDWGHHVEEDGEFDPNDASFHDGN